ncbi:MAG: cell wall-binding repeat-containing protein [Solirubrobacteraceae bacterium]
MLIASLRAATLVLLACATLLAAGCGKTLSPQANGHATATVPAIGEHAAIGASTTNTTRLGGSSPVVDAAAVALAAYPGLTPATRPPLVVMVDDNDWPAALASSVLAGKPLRTPLLYSEGSTLPQPTSMALQAMRPTGTNALGPSPSGPAGRAQVLDVGGTLAPAGYVTRSLAAAEPAVLAVAIERLSNLLDGHSPHDLIVTAANGPPAMTMPAAGLSAQTGAPILFVRRSRIPHATAAELARLAGASIYVVGPRTVVSERVVRELRHFGPVTRIDGPTPAANAIAVARFSNGSFGWGVLEPGHGLVFANSSRPLDAPAAAPLSARGDYGPLLLLENAEALPSQLSGYLSDLQPGSPASGPVHGVYNRGWLIGDETAISATTQARLDTLLEISSRTAPEASFSSPTTPSSEATPSESTQGSEP